jgi:putative protease
MAKSLEKVGEVSHYFTKIGVAVIELTGKIKVGDSIAVKGMTTNFEQKVESMQVEGENIEEANPGDDIGMKVADRVRKFVPPSSLSTSQSEARKWGIALSGPQRWGRHEWGIVLLVGKPHAREHQDKPDGLSVRFSEETCNKASPVEVSTIFKEEKMKW